VSGAAPSPAMQGGTSILPAMDLVDQLSRRGLDCVCGNLRMAARAVSSVYDRHLAGAGIQASQMAVLWAVSSADGVTVKELAARLAMHETTLIRTLRILEREGLVALDVGDDRRQRIPRLTRSGRTVFARALVGWKKAQSEIADLLDDELAATNKKLVHLARAAWRS
jgi:DNA-binding MarR family transcriptional regulator